MDATDGRTMTARLATAAAGIPLLLLLVWLGNPSFTVLVGLLAVVATIELCSIGRAWGDRPITPLAVVWAVALVLAAQFISGDQSDARTVYPIVTLASITLMASMLWCHGSGTLLAGIGVTAGAALYTGGLLSHAVLLRDLDQGIEWVFLLLFVTFAADTAAFFVGRAFGSRPLAPSISPKKTWEGTVAGLAGAIAACVVAIFALDIDHAAWEPYVLGSVLGVAGQAGDLLVSRLKRIGGVKDSGRTVPGHGGVLDRLDSVVPNLVVVYYFAI